MFGKLGRGPGGGDIKTSYDSASLADTVWKILWKGGHAFQAFEINLQLVFIEL